jgi:hypothetical protein
MKLHILLGMLLVLMMALTSPFSAIAEENTMQQVYEKARKYILQHGTELQQTALLHIVGEADSDALVKALQAYQNADGGWANGLEIEYQGAISTPMTTAAALGYISMFGLGNTDLLKKTLEYLKEVQQADGSWDDAEAITQFPIPDYMGPGKYVEFKTGMMLKWLRRLQIEDANMPGRAYQYLLDRFPDILQGNDFWTAAAYANAFSEYPPTEEHQRIVQWAQQALTPPEAQQQPAPENATLPWMMIQGLLHDDSYLLVPMKEQVLASIRANQLPTGGWPHPFGDYNAVWAAVLVVRYLKIHEQI